MIEESNLLWTINQIVQNKYLIQIKDKDYWYKSPNSIINHKVEYLIHKTQDKYIADDFYTEDELKDLLTFYAIIPVNHDLIIKNIEKNGKILKYRYQQDSFI